MLMETTNGASRHVVRCAAAFISLFASGIVHSQVEGFNWSISSAFYTGGGTLGATSIGNGQYLVTSISGVLNGGSPVSLLPTTSPLPPQPDQAAHGNTTYISPKGLFTYDNVIYTGSALTISLGLSLDPEGIGLLVAGGEANLSGFPIFAPQSGYYYGDSTTLKTTSLGYVQVSAFISDAGPLLIAQSNAGQFSFNATVVADQSYLLDPPIATGYSFSTGTGNPNFKTVLFPTLQAASYHLTFASGSGPVTDIVAPGALFTFPEGGVSSFVVTGIDKAVGLNPDDPMAFGTTVTFVSSGTFTGTQTPLISAVPEPSNCALMLLGLSGIGFIRRKGKGTR